MIMGAETIKGRASGSLKWGAHRTPFAARPPLKEDINWRIYIPYNAFQVCNLVCDYVIVVGGDGRKEADCRKGLSSILDLSVIALGVEGIDWSCIYVRC